MPNLYSGKSDCCGCGACVAVCPKRCITMVRDEEGFDYPLIDLDNCIQCGKCEAVCPWKHEPVLQDRRTPPDVHAAWSLDEVIRRQSSSGGVFSVLAKQILAQGGAVVGAAFTDDFHAVEHVIVENEEGLARLRGSKYVQSIIAPYIFIRIDEMIIKGRLVLFSGCPCQVAGLRLFLGENQKTLLTCDLVCHGVPSPEWYERHCQQLEEQHSSKLVEVSFRDKSNGWKQIYSCYSFANMKCVRQRWEHDFFFWTFSQDYCLRESCYICRYAKPIRVGDITIGDYWGVKSLASYLDEHDKGVNFLAINSTQGWKFVQSITGSVLLHSASIEHAAIRNPNLIRPTHKPLQRMTFFADYALMGYKNLYTRYGLPRRSIIRKIVRAVLDKLKLKVFFKLV